MIPIGLTLTSRQAFSQVYAHLPYKCIPVARLHLLPTRNVNYYSALPSLLLHKNGIYLSITRRAFLTSSLLKTLDPRPPPNDLPSTKVSKPGEKDYEKDLVIYEQGTPDHFKKLSFLSVLQLIFFVVTAFTFGGLRDTGDTPASGPQETSEERFQKLTISDQPASSADELPFWRRYNLGDAKLKGLLQMGSLTLGYVFLFGTWIFIYRHVHFIVLRKDPRAATIVTYAPFGRRRHVDVLVNEVSADGSRTNKLFPSMKLRVKGHALSYKIDLRNGRFRRPELFDSTMGRRRNFD